jgi:hypothetical protein
VPTSLVVTPFPDLGSEDYYAWETDVDAWIRALASGAATGVGVAPNVITADYTITVADEMGLVAANAAGATTVTVPPNSAVNFPQGIRVFIVQANTGQVTVAAGAGVTLRTAPGRDATTRGQFSIVELRQAAVDTWYLSGDLTGTDVSAASQAYTDAAVDYAPIVLMYDFTNSQWPIRPNTTGTNRRPEWVGPSPGPASGGTTAGGTRAYAPGDLFRLS